MAEAPQAGEVATRGAYQVAGTVIDCEVTQRAGLTLTGANLACYLSLQMSPAEAEGKRCPGSRLHSGLMGLIQRRGSCIICHPQLFVLFCFMAISAIESSATLSDHRHIKSLVCRAAIFYPFPNILWKLTKLGVFLNSYHGYNEQSRK